MRVQTLALMLAASLAGAAPALAAETPAAPAAAARYSSATTDIGTLLDTPATRAVIDKVLPGLSTNAQIDMARGMTLRAIQQFAPDKLTDERLAAVDAELAKLK